MSDDHLTPEREAEIRQYVAASRRSVAEFGALAAPSERNQALLLDEVDRLRAFRAEMERLAAEWMANSEVLIDAEKYGPKEAGIADALSTCSMVVRTLLNGGAQ